MIININQMNNRLSSYLISLNTNQTTTNEQSPLILSDLTEHKSDHNKWTITSHLIWSHWTQIRPPQMNNHLSSYLISLNTNQTTRNEQSPLILSDLTEHKSDHNKWTITSHLIWSHWTQIRPQQMNNHLSSYLISLNTNQTTTYHVGNLGPGLGRAQKCGGIKQVNGIPTLPSW
jgi:hypothetical protein